MKKIITLFFATSATLFTYATTWHVGATQTYTLPSAVVNLVNNGDTILFDAGIYLNDPVKWVKNNLVFIGLGNGNNRSVMQWNGGDISNGKGLWVFDNPSLTGNITVDNIVFEGARVSDNDGGNGAGIRYQAMNLTIKNCLFQSCQNGILEGGGYSGSVITIENSEFNNNGYEVTGGTYSGYEHNIYISAQTDSLLVKNCYFHDPRGEANSLKTRAQKSYILYNVIDEANGQGSWELNIAQGGLVVAMGNTIVQGANSVNHGIIGYDATTNPIENFYFINNTVVNKYAGNYTFFNIVPSTGINVFKVYNNVFTSISSATMTNFISGTLGGALDTMANRIIADYTTIGFVDAANNDFHLTSNATSLIDNAVNAGTATSGFLLKPIYQYINFSSALAVRSTIGTHDDIGAFEMGITASVAKKTNDLKTHCYPNPSSEYIVFEINEPTTLSNMILTVYDINGKIVVTEKMASGKIRLTTKEVFANGIYNYSIATDQQQIVSNGKFIIQ